MFNAQTHTTMTNIHSTFLSDEDFGRTHLISKQKLNKYEPYRKPKAFLHLTVIKLENLGL